MPRHNQGPYLSDQPNDSGFYEIRWTENGRSKRRSTGQADRRAAQRVYAEFLLALDQEDLTAGGVTVARCLDAYLADKTGVVAREHLENKCAHLRAYLGDVAVADFDQADADRYLKARLQGQVGWTTEDGREHGFRKAKGPTARNELITLCTAIRWCAAKKKFKDVNGASLLKAAHVPELELPADSRPRDRWLTREEAARFLKACEFVDPKSNERVDRLSRVYRFVALALYTASRKTAIVRLTWDRIQLQEDPVKLAAGDYGMINFRAPGEPMTKKRRGWVPIAAELYPILLRARRERVSDFYLDRKTEPAGAFRNAVRRSGVKGVTPHVLRHTWATWAAQDGQSLYVIAGVLHDSVKTVEQHYAHHCPDHLRGAVNRRILAA